MTVLVTGAGGFIGSHVVDALLRAGHHVRAMVRYSSNGSVGWLEGCGAEVFRGDIRDQDSMYQAIIGCEAVIHLAALGGIPHSYDCPQSYIDTNITGTMNVLKAADRQGARVILTSTSEVYGTARADKQDEHHPLVAQSPYAASKIAADQIGLAFHRSFDLPVTIVRPFNTYGPRQSPRAIIPKMILGKIRGELVRVGNLKPTRDFLHVTDTAQGFVRALDHGTAGNVYNLGTGNDISIVELAILLDCALVSDHRGRPDASEVMRLCCDAQKARDMLDWKPSLALYEGLQATEAWYRDNAHRFPEGFEK